MQPEDLMLLTDFYEYTMAYAYFKENKHEEIAYFDMFVRTIPDGGGFLILNGLHRFIDFVQHFHYTDDQIDYLRQTGYFDEDFLHYLKTMTMDVDVWQYPEGTPVFANEPLVTIRGTLIQAQILETILLFVHQLSNLDDHQSLPYRPRQQGPGRSGIWFTPGTWLRRRHRGSPRRLHRRLRGSACTIAGQKYAASGQRHDRPQLCSAARQRAGSLPQLCPGFPDNRILLVDTYDMLHSGIPNAIKVAQEELIPNGHRLKESGSTAAIWLICQRKRGKCSMRPV